MFPQSRSSDGELDCHCVRADRERVAALLEDDAARLGFRPVPPASLPPYGRWGPGEEDPSLVRLLVGPEENGWTPVLSSLTDWHHELAERLSAALPGTVVHFMLHDDDVFTLHAFDRGIAVAEYVSSPEHFDMPPRAPTDLGVDLVALLGVFPEGTSPESLRRALSPPGRIDVDGRRALALTAMLLGATPRVAACYQSALEDDGLTVRPEFSDYLHLAFRSGPDEADDEDFDDDEDDAAEGGEGASDGKVVPFRR